MAFLDDTGAEWSPYIGEESAFESDAIVQGTSASSTPPTVSDRPESSRSSPFSGLLQILGSIGTTARDVGTAVGTVRRDIANASQQYRTAQSNARSGNTMGQWWQYATMQDKIVVGLAVLGIVVVVIKS